MLKLIGWLECSQYVMMSDNIILWLQDLVVLYDSLQLAHKCILNSFYGYVMRKWVCDFHLVLNSYNVQSAFTVASMFVLSFKWCFYMFFFQGCKMVLHGNGWSSDIYRSKNNSECSFIGWKNWKATWIRHRWYLVCAPWLFSGELYFQNQVWSGSSWFT